MVDDWFVQYLADWFCFGCLVKHEVVVNRYLFTQYVTDIFSRSPMYDDWLTRFRRDSMPNRFGRIEMLPLSKAEKRLKRGDVLLKDLVLVGRGDKTYEHCAQFLKWHGCIQHNPAWVKPVFNYCHRPSCSSCYKWGWAARESLAIGLRLEVASKKFGMPAEHLTVSLPVMDYGLTLRRAKVKSLKILADSGVFGGSVMPHHQRFNPETKAERYSPHFHVLGFFKNGIEECRKCSDNPDVVGYNNACRSCGKTFSYLRGEVKRSGYFVKVFGERESVPLTAFYQLHHASLEPDRARARVATYFGSCGYSNLGVAVVKPKPACGVCGSLTSDLKYVGSEPLPIIPRWHENFKEQFLKSLYGDDGKRVFEVLDRQESLTFRGG